MVVDAPLDMGGFGFIGDVANITTLTTATATAGIVKTDKLDEDTPGAGTQVLHPGSAEAWLAVASEFVRYEDLPSTGFAYASYTGALKTVTVPANYRAGSIARVKITLRAAAGGTAFGRIYVNGAAVGVNHSTTSTTGEDFVDDIPCKGGDTLEVWGYKVGGTAYLSNVQVCADDTLPLFAKNSAW
jgi:hypothetical protein